MKRVVKKSFLLLSLCLFILLLINFVSAEVVINEFLADSNASTDKEGEWIELYNNGTSSVNLNDWNISEIQKNFTITDITIGSREFVLFVYNFTIFNESFPNVNASGSPKIVEYGPFAKTLSLNDAGDTINLYNNSGDIANNYTYSIQQEDVSEGRYPDGSATTGFTFTVPTPGAKNDKEAPVFNKWVRPSANNSYIAGLYNITVNITDLAYSVNQTILGINTTTGYTNYTMNRSGDLFYYVLNTTPYNDHIFNFTVYFNDTLGFSGTDSILDITIDNTNPTITSGNLTGVNSRNFIFPGAKFNETVNVTDNYGIKNVTCYLNGNLVGYYQNITHVYYCELTAPTAQDDYTITFTAYDLADNINTTTASFTTKYSTTANLTTQDITVSGLNQSDKIVEVNITFNNKGSSTIYSPNIILDSFSTSFAQANNANITCAANLSAGQSCSSTFNVTIFGGKITGDHTIFWNANWTDNNFTDNQLEQAARSYVTINSNPQITVTENRTAAISHNANQTLNISLNSTGNAPLQNVNIAFTPITLQSSWVNIIPSGFSSISSTVNETFNVTVAIPPYTSPGNYTGTLTITATGAETKTILLTAEVPQDSSWTSHPETITTYKITNSAGLLGTVYINNSGNIGQEFTFSPSGSLYFYVWDNSNPTSQYVEKGTTEAVSFYHLANGPLDSYAATLTITSQNTSATNITYMDLTRDDDNPNINITSPLNNSFVKGLVDFNVSAEDLNLSRIEYYVNNNLVFNDTGINYTYDLNTSAYSDEEYTLRAIAYDTAGNYNTSQIDVTVNNTDDNPILISNIPAITWNEDTTTTINLSNYFKSIDGDILSYTSATPNNVTVSINNTSLIATFTPDADFFGTRYVIFYAADSSNNITASNNITLTINNINDAPSAPSLLLPANNSAVFSATGRVTLNWTESADADNDALTYYVFYGNDTNVTSSATTQNKYLTLLNLNNRTIYYWRVYAGDGTNNSANSSMFSFTVTVDDAPVINSFTPSSLTPSVAENSTLEFTINASDPDGGLLNYSWYLDSTLEKTDGNNYNYTPNFTASGTHTVLANVTDNNSNTVTTDTWAVTVTNTDRAPVLAAINNQTVDEDSVLLFNITASDEDNDNLTYSSDSSLTISKINNSIATVSWMPTNDYVGNNTISFTVSDGSLTDSQLVTITVTNTNDAPSINSYYPTNLNPRIAANTGSQLFNVTPSDPDASDTTSTTWLRDNVQVGTGNSYTASSLTAGQYNITAKVNDTSGSATQQEWTLNATTNIISGSYSGSILDHNITEENASGISVNESSYGSIGFLATVNLSNAANIDDYINISNGVISINTNALQGLNRSASVIMKGLNFTKVPLIYYNEGFNLVSGGSICNPETTPSCTNIIYDSTTGILKFNLEHFSTYYTGTNTTNGAPYITSTPETSATAREPYTYDVDASDPDGDTLTYLLTSSPGGMSISSSTGEISWTPSNSQAGMHNITVRVSDGSLTDNQTFNISVAEAKKLRIKSLDVKVNSKSDKGVTDEDTIKKEAEPESEIEFKVEVESGFEDEDDIKIEDIVVEVTIKDIDDGDDLDEESKGFDLRPERDKSVTLKFKTPLEVEEDTYDVDIHVEGEDENGTMHEVDWTVYLEVEKEKHNIRIIKASLSPAIVKCQKTASLATEILNLGREDEDEVVLEITSPDLVSFRKENIELYEGTDDDNRYSSSLKITVPDNLGVGTYPIEIFAYYDSTRLSDTETVNLEVQECKEVKKEKEAAKTEPVVVINKTQPTPTVKPKEEVTKITFKESPAYMAFLALSFVVLSGLVVFVLSITIVLLKKK